MNLKEMTSCEAHLEGNQRVYTYAIKPEAEVKPGQRYLTNTPSKGYTYVNVRKVHKVSQLDPNAKFEYKELVHPVLVEKEGTHFKATIPSYPGDFFGKAFTEEAALQTLFEGLNR